MLIDVESIDGPRKIRVCDYCRAVPIPSGRFCSGRCSRQFYERYELQVAKEDEPKPPGEADVVERVSD